MFEQEGVRSAPEEYARKMDDEFPAQSHRPLQKSASHEVISRLSKKFMDSSSRTGSLPIVRRTKQESIADRLVSTLDPNILRNKLRESSVESVNWSDGQTLNLFKWINLKKKKPKIDGVSELARTPASASSASEVAAVPDGKNSIPPFTIELFEHFQLLQKILDQTPLSIDEEKKSEWIQYLTSLCNEHPRSGENLLGKVIYVLDHLPKKFCRHFSESEPKEHIAWIEEAFDMRMHLIKKQVKALHQLFLAQETQPPSHVLQTKLPFAVAQTLITSGGDINYALCPSLVKHLLPPSMKRQPFHQDICRVLGLVQKSRNIRKLLSEIDIPSNQYSLANHLIRVQMGVEYSSHIYKRDAVVTALTACLSHLRQGPTGSCFATHFAIVLLSSHIEQCIEDFQMLLRESKLTRVVEGVQKDFPFLLMMSSPSSGEELTLTREGKVILNNGSYYDIWDSPGLQAACRSIKIEHHKKTITLVLQEYFNDKKSDLENAKINIQTLISLLCDHQVKACNLLPSKKMKLYSLAHFAYASQARNGLLSVWENSIAEMAEGKEGSMIMPPLLHAIQKPLLNMIVEALSVDDFPTSLRDTITLELSHELQKRIHLHYDPDIFNDSIDSNHTSSEGGYVIYDTLHEIYPNRWHRIDTPEEYSSFISSVFEEVTPKISDALQVHFPSQYSDKVMKNILKQIVTPAFVHKSMITYYPAYRSKKDLLANWNKCKYTPWRTLSGNLADKVREVYMEDDGQVEKSVLNPANAQDLLINLLSEIKQMPAEIREVYRKNPNKKIPVFTPTHAFSLMLGHDSLQRYADTELSCGQWIKDNIVTPCRDAISQKISKEARQRVIAFASDQIPLLSKKEEFLDAARLLPPDLDYPKFRTCLIKLLDIIDSQSPKREERVFLIDSELCKNLPDEVRQVISDHAIHFADTNWSEELQDIHLCVTLNPCTGKLAIMQIYGNGEGMKPVKQYWLLNQNWEFIYNPEQALPKDNI